MGTYSSVTRMGAYEPFDLQIARGQVDGHSIVSIFGYSAAVGSTAQGPLWEGLTLSGGNYVYPSSAAPLVLVSDSATVIILGNKFNRGIWSAGKMSSVFTGRADTTHLDEYPEK